MTNLEIPYTTINEQIAKLKHQGLIIEDEEFAKSELQLYGYSNLIKSYRDPYIYIDNGKKLYRSGVTFEQIWSLFILDKNLRNAVMASMLDLEERIKEAAADVIANSFGCHQDSYLNFKNYRDKKKYKPQFSLEAIINNMKKTLNTTKDPIAHYYNNYETVPPWILFKSVYFSTIVNFVNLFKPREQTAMTAKLYNNSKLDQQSLTCLMMDTMFICLEYRNLAAHGGRIYNYSCNSKLRFIASTENNINGFSQLLFILRLMDYQTPFDHLNDALSQQLNRHCNSYPEDITYLAQILNINIAKREIVWVAPKSNKYHFDKHCSGIKNAVEIDLFKAKEQNFIPCQKCIK